ncbi:accessory gene regulator ArgB-like protein [Paenibacillus sp. MBLB4367]|uniref:accessory gene regulator ArgB-like protein n=1 Tax=Paenibacillus sp. MBLB4367 TaxID=3384767 RepID=UPI00390803AF
MIVEKVSDYLAVKINQNTPNASSVGVLRYALIGVINTILITLMVLVVASITGHILSAVVVLVAFPVLRYFSGGLHLNSSTKCNILSTLFLLLSIYLPVNYWYIGFVMNILSVLILAVYAPSGIERNTLGPKYNPILKAIAVVIVCMNFIFQSHVLAAAFFLQALTTPPILRRFIEK